MFTAKEKKNLFAKRNNSKNFVHGPARKKLKLCRSKSTITHYLRSKDNVNGCDNGERNPLQNTSRCRYCQMPVGALIVQSLEEHFEECVLVDHQSKEICPDGTLCASTVISHYMNFSHNDVSGLEKESVVTTVSEEETVTFDSDVEVVFDINTDQSPGKLSSSIPPSPKPTKHCSRYDHLAITRKASPQKPVFQATSESPCRRSLKQHSANVLKVKPDSILENPSCKPLFPNSPGQRSLSCHGANSWPIAAVKCSPGNPVFQATLYDTPPRKCLNHHSTDAQPDTTSSPIQRKPMFQRVSSDSSLKFANQHSTDTRKITPQRCSPNKPVFQAMSPDSSPKKFSNQHSAVSRPVTTPRCCPKKPVLQALSPDSSPKKFSNQHSADSRQVTTPRCSPKQPVLQAMSPDSFLKKFSNRHSTDSWQVTASRSSPQKPAFQTTSPDSSPVKYSNKHSTDTQQTTTQKCSPRRTDFYPLSSSPAFSVQKTQSSCSSDAQQVSPNKSSPQKLVFQATITSFFSSSTSTGETKPKITLLKPEHTIISPQKCTKPLHFQSLPSKYNQTHSSGYHESVVRSSGSEDSLFPRRKFDNQSQKFAYFKNSSWGNQMQYQSNRRQSKKECPFYKRIPDTTFVVDAFSYGKIPGVTCYFLSHFHADHYIGLSKSFSGHLYCSEVTANLVQLKLRVQERCIHRLPLNEPVAIEGVNVILLEANHCPGSVMFLFTLPDGREILHTGDFRANSEMEWNLHLIPDQVDQLFLDTTYCNPKYTFPSQEAVLSYVTSVVVKKVSENSKVLIICGTYTIGKEKVFQAIASALDCKIWASTEKQRVLRCLNDKSLNNRLTSKQEAAKVHVLMMANLNFKSLNQHLSNLSHFNEIMAFKPTGWEYRSTLTNETLYKIRPITRGAISIYGVPYSEHSSFTELKRFVQFLRPKKVIPTVGMGDKNARLQINSLISDWLK